MTITLIVAATGNASKAPAKPASVPPINVLTITAANERWTAFYMTRGTST
jgi:hypothetical protein